MIIEHQHVYIGSYTDNQNQPGIYDLLTRDLTALKLNIPCVNPSYVLNRKKYLYVVQQTNNGRLNVIDNEYNVVKVVQTHGDDPCHIAINQQGNRITITNYSSGSFIVYQLNDGIPSHLSAFVMHEGSSTNTDRQCSPHPHCSVFSYDDQILFVSDLGTDTVYYYTVKYQGEESLICEKDKCLKLPGTGPRHLARGDPSKKFLYLSGQLDSSIRVLSYESGKLEQLSAYRVSNNPTNFPSEICYYKGDLVMANRGDNYLIIFEALNIGILKEKFRFKVGQWPRHFNISKTGTIFVACQYENTVQRYKLQNDKVFQLGSLKISKPSCINFGLCNLA